MHHPRTNTWFHGSMADTVDSHVDFLTLFATETKMMTSGEDIHPKLLQIKSHIVGVCVQSLRLGSGVDSVFVYHCSDSCC